jgi:hypothetical protein
MSSPSALVTKAVEALVVEVTLSKMRSSEKRLECRQLERGVVITGGRIICLRIFHRDGDA